MRIDMLIASRQGSNGETSMPECYLWSMTIAGRNQIIYQLNYWQTLGCRALEPKGSDVLKRFPFRLIFALWPLFCILHNCQMIDYRSTIPLSPVFVLCGVFANSALMICWFIVSDPAILVPSSRASLSLFAKGSCRIFAQPLAEDSDLCWQKDNWLKSF